jgi:hypothetical protein
LFGCVLREASSGFTVWVPNRLDFPCGLLDGCFYQGLTSQFLTVMLRWVLLQMLRQSE